MPGLFVVPAGVAIARVVDDLLLIDECSEPSEWEGRIAFLPLD